ncbi:VOC family protein [Nonlabens marinus]|uniref:Glyoxalase/Bleomycin resistance protein/Dioxygenase family protein n=1 Tax=Nonlabens marinus S1-08 TaxID=1454201 RepID=W8VUB8_9FLAO|nr:glyoxalase/bleomycin resistance/dioxygenase family protein [Nonlabens marinus]BAO54463.1 Glyoxalase/Bleomycin resistance protein/Dioxygenase family protein [Nonlabens marinus S1-08]
MKKVTGIGGIFFKCADVQVTKDWYEKNLGIEGDQYGHTFWQRDAENPEQKTSQQWSPFPKDTDYFQPSDQEFMINYRVENLDQLLVELQSNGVTLVGEPQDFDYGKFAWALDVDGRKIELWEPKNEHLFEK